MWTYNRDEHPPSPILDITLHYPEDSTCTIHISAKLDTGADISALPVTAIEQLVLSNLGCPLPANSWSKVTMAIRRQYQHTALF
jgi:hypothetical protein